MNVMNRSMFVNRDARSKLAGMGGIMSSSPELMSAGRQGFADGGQTSFLERVNEVGVEKAPTYIISSPELTGGDFLEISAETLSALNSVVPNLVTPDGESIFVADAASVSPLSREQARPGDAIVGTRLKQMMAQMQSTPQAAPAPALDDVFDQRIRQGLEPDRRASLDEELFDSAVYRADDTAGQGQALAEAYALGNSPKQLMQEASSVTPMDMSNGDPDFSGIMELQQAKNNAEIMSVSPMQGSAVTEGSHLEIPPSGNELVKSDPSSNVTNYGARSSPGIGSPRSYSMPSVTNDNPEQIAATIAEDVDKGIDATAAIQSAVNIFGGAAIDALEFVIPKIASGVEAIQAFAAARQAFAAARPPATEGAAFAEPSTTGVAELASADLLDSVLAEGNSGNRLAQQHMLDGGDGYEVSAADDTILEVSAAKAASPGFWSNWVDNFTKTETQKPITLTVEKTKVVPQFETDPGTQEVVPPIAQKSAIENAVIAATADEKTDEDGALSFQDKIDALNAAGYDPQKVSDEFTSMALKEAGFPGNGTPTQNNRYYKDLIKDIMGDDKSDKEKHQEKWNNFAMIGFAIAAGQSPSAMTNIAQGMLQGTKLMANQREADQARRDKLKGMEFDMLLSDRAAGQDRKTKFGVAKITADSRAATAAAKAAAESILDTTEMKEISKKYNQFAALQHPHDDIIKELKKIYRTPDGITRLEEWLEATAVSVGPSSVGPSSDETTTIMGDIPD